MMNNLRINCSSPTDWRDLQDKVNQIFQECGFKSEIAREIKTVRGIVEVDIHAEDLSSQPVTIYLCECKNWQARVPQSVVHSFRTVVADYGANWGFIISSAGFQSGAYKAVDNTPIQLLTWEEFQELFVDRWIQNYMIPRLHSEVDSLIPYTEPLCAVPYNKEGEFPKERFRELCEKYADLAFLALSLYLPMPTLSTKQLKLPLRNTIKGELQNYAGMPDDLLDAICLRDFVDIICKHSKEGITAFRELFGVRT